jgi:hypothetical protein
MVYDGLCPLYYKLQRVLCLTQLFVHLTFSFQNLTESIDKILHIQGGSLVERRLHQRKWKWVVHGSPKDQHLTSITPILQDELNEKFISMFLTTSSGSIYEYRIPKQTGESNRHYEKTY